MTITTEPPGPDVVPEPAVGATPAAAGVAPRRLLHVLPASALAVALAHASSLPGYDRERAGWTVLLVATGWLLALGADDLFGDEAQIDAPGAPRYEAGRHFMDPARWRPRHRLGFIAVLVAVTGVAYWRLLDGAPAWWIGMPWLLAFLALSPCGPYVRARRRGASEVVVAATLAVPVPLLVTGAAAGVTSAATVVLAAPVALVAAGMVLAYTSRDAEWDGAHDWRSLPARLGAASSRRLAAGVVVAGLAATVGAAATQKPTPWTWVGAGLAAAVAGLVHRIRSPRALVTTAAIATALAAFVGASPTFV